MVTINASGSYMLNDLMYGQQVPPVTLTPAQKVSQNHLRSHRGGSPMRSGSPTGAMHL